MGLSPLDWKFDFNTWGNSYYIKKEGLMLEILSTVFISILSLVYVFYPLIDDSLVKKEVDWDN